jgi:hypothetical protein
MLADRESLVAAGSSVFIDVSRLTGGISAHAEAAHFAIPRHRPRNA